MMESIISAMPFFLTCVGVVIWMRFRERDHRPVSRWAKAGVIVVMVWAIMGPLAIMWTQLQVLMGD